MKCLCIVKLSKYNFLCTLDSSLRPVVVNAAVPEVTLGEAENVVVCVCFCAYALDHATLFFFFSLHRTGTGSGMRENQ